MFFELNGQPRLVRVQLAGAKAEPRRTRVEDGNPRHVGAPVPGVVATLAVKLGQQIDVGSPLVSLEAMKMVSMVCAEHKGVVVAIHVTSGDQVDAKDLLIELELAQG